MSKVESAVWNPGVSPEEQAVADLIVDTQIRLHQLMKLKGVNRADLSSKLGLSKARISAIFGERANPTLETIARILHALGENGACLSLPSVDQKMAELSGEAARSAKNFKIVNDLIKNIENSILWSTSPANVNEKEDASQGCAA